MRRQDRGRPTGFQQDVILDQRDDVAGGGVKRRDEPECDGGNAVDRHRDEPAESREGAAVDVGGVRGRVNQDDLDGVAPGLRLQVAEGFGHLGEAAGHERTAVRVSTAMQPVIVDAGTRGCATAHGLCRRMAEGGRAVRRPDSTPSCPEVLSHLP